MLDGIPCDGRACYTNSTAKSVTWGINSDGTLLKWSGVFWAKASNGDTLVDSGSAYFSKSATGMTTYNYPANLYYDAGYAAVYSWVNANATCSGKGAKLPSIYGTSAGISGGVPNAYNTYNWAYETYDGSGHYYWSGTTLYNYGGQSNASGYFRCVK